jgi:preprotein translocase subunit SecF
MHNLSDQELDRLSKEAAEKYEAAASPALWDKVLLRLDAEMPEKKKDKRRFFWLFIFAGLILGSLTVGITVMNRQAGVTNAINPGTDFSGSAQAEKQAAYSKTDKPQISDTVQEIDEKARLQETVAVSSQKNQLSVPGKQKTDPPSRAGTRPSNQKPAKTTHKEKQVAATPVTFHVPLSKTEKSLPITSAEPAGQTEKKNPSTLDAVEQEKPVQQNMIPDSSAVFEKTGKKAESAERTDSAKALDQSVANPTASKSAVNITPEKRLEISAVFGPDFSNVGFVSPDKTGMNIGIIAGYRFTERLSVQTGLLYSQKHYTAVGDTYKGYPGYISGNPNLKMKWVQANCFMWDVPVNIRYDWLLRKKQRAFASVGVSSYFMNKEDLHYYYSYYNNPAYKSWVNEKNSSFWMSALNLSIGFDQRISRVLSVQAEPFMKLPVREIGSGKIELNSFGIFLSLKYSPAPNLFKNKKTR